MIIIKNNTSTPMKIPEKKFINQIKIGYKKILSTDLIDKILAFYQLIAKLAIINSISALEKPVIFKKDFKNGH